MSVRRSDLSTDQETQLRTAGFVVVPDLVAAVELTAIRIGYDAAMAAGAGDDFRVGSSTTRLDNLLSRGSEFDFLCQHPAILTACRSLIEAPFKLSSMLARTLRPRTSAQELHTDVKRDSHAFPMVGVIFMVDDFREDNGATRFVPGSHIRNECPPIGQVLACGKAASVIIFHASVWHGHTANVSQAPRRSIQGYFVPDREHFPKIHTWY